MTIFSRIEKLLAAHQLANVGQCNIGSEKTIIVIGELHYVPKAHCEELDLLLHMREALGLDLVCYENTPLRTQELVNSYGKPNVQRARSDAKYMKWLMQRGFTAVDLFQHEAGKKVRFVKTDDSFLYTLSCKIDDNAHRMFLAAQSHGGAHLLPPELRAEYEIWLALQKNVLLAARSDFMVLNTHKAMEKLGRNLAVLIVGYSHTPYRMWHEPYSVQRLLDILPVNYTIKVLPSVVEDVRKRKDPFDLFTQLDKDELNPYS